MAFTPLTAEQYGELRDLFIIVSNWYRVWQRVPFNTPVGTRYKARLEQALWTYRGVRHGVILTSNLPCTHSPTGFCTYDANTAPVVNHCIFCNAFVIF